MDKNATQQRLLKGIFRDHSRDNALNFHQIKILQFGNGNQMYELNPERNSENMPPFNHKTALHF